MGSRRPFQCAGFDLVHRALASGKLGIAHHNRVLELEQCVSIHLKIEHLVVAPVGESGNGG